MLGMLGAAAAARGEHGGVHGRGRDGAVPPLLAGAARGRWRWRRRPASVARLLGRWSIAAAVALAALLLALRADAGVLARAGQLGGRRRHRGDRRRADPRAAPRHRPRPVVGGVAADRGDAGRADPAQRRAPCSTRRGRGRTGPPRADLAVGLTPGSRGLVRRPRPAAPGGDGRGAPAVRAGRRGARVRRRPARGADARGAEDRHRRPAPGLGSGSSTRRRPSRSALDLLSRWDVTHVLVDLEDQSDVAGAIMALPGLAEVYRDDRFVILRAAPCIAERSCPVSATGSDDHVGGDAGRAGHQQRDPPARRRRSAPAPPAPPRRRPRPGPAAAGSRRE